MPTDLPRVPAWRRRRVRTDAPADVVAEAIHELNNPWKVKLMARSSAREC